MSDEYTRAELEAIEAFCRELALALRRITGRVVEIKPGDLPVPLKESEPESPQAKDGTTNTEETEENEEP
jgi:hypothetical protein